MVSDWKGRCIELAVMGRPKSENPKEHKVSVRLTEDEYNQLKQYASGNNLTIAQFLREGIVKMLAAK